MNIADATFNASVVEARILSGTMLSVKSTSFANRFTRRPIGVVSKYHMGARITRDNICRCNVAAARNVEIANRTKANR
jgi:hypothetical protein